jgi:hypothetical protein
MNKATDKSMNKDMDKKKYGAASQPQAKSDSGSRMGAASVGTEGAMNKSEAMRKPGDGAGQPLSSGRPKSR